MGITESFMGITERFLICLITVVFNKRVYKLGTKVSKYKKAFYASTYYGVVFNPFSTNLLLFPLKTSENLWFSDISGAIEVEHWLKMG